MYDTISYDASGCYVCGKPLGELQSKDGECDLQFLTPTELLEQSGREKAVFYGYCEDENGHLDHLNEFEVYGSPPVVRLKTDIKEAK